MDINILRISITVASMALFVVLMVHTYSRRRTDEFLHAEQLPFLGDEWDAAEHAAVITSQRAQP